MCDHGKAVANPSVHQTLDELEFERSLCNAALNGEIEKVKRHLLNGDNVNTLDAGGYAPLHYAARNCHIDIAQLLISHGGNVDIRTRAGKVTPLLRAAFSGKEDMCKFLIKNGADVKAVDDDGQTVIHRAINSGNLSLAKYFLDIVPELKMQADNRGTSPLQLANSGL